MSSAGCLSATELREIVGRASNLTERVQGGLVPTGRDHAAAARRLDRWKQLAAQHDPAVFARILASYGLAGASERQLRELLGEMRYPSERAMPPWATFLGEMTQTVSAAFLAGSRPRVPAKANRTVPFAGLYAPVAALARRKVAAAAPAQMARLGPRAWEDLERHLLKRLAAICSPALQPKFLAFQAARRPVSAATSRAESGHPGRSLYEEFVDAQGAQGLRALFLEYPVAARLAAEVTLRWIDFVGEVLGRLEADAEALAAEFRGGKSLGEITSLQAGVSDPHRGGRSVLIACFAGGPRIVYKPRPLQIEAAFFEWLGWLNTRRRRQAPLRTLKLLARTGYGWVEFAENTPCRSGGPARRFYRQAGALLYVLQALRGIDFHCENMIAGGDGPVMVDLEALFHPAFPGAPPGVPAPLEAGVLSTGMLPMRRRHFKETRFIERSALGAPVRQRSVLAGICWSRINSDQMAAGWGYSSHSCPTHRLRQQGSLLSVRDFASELANGFAQTARLLRADVALAREWAAGVARIARWPARLIKRPTLVYIALLQNSLHPRLLTLGVERSIELEALPLVGEDGPGRRAELAALEGLDVPYFSHLPTPGLVTRAGFPETEADLKRQLAAIIGCVTAGSSDERNT